MVAFRHIDHSPVNRLGRPLTAGSGFHLTSRHRFREVCAITSAVYVYSTKSTRSVERESSGTQTTVYGFIAISGCLREFEGFLRHRELVERLTVVGPLLKNSCLPTCWRFRPTNLPPMLLDTRP
jgi:hypothetical protein